MLQNDLVWPNSTIRAALFIRLTFEEGVRAAIKKKESGLFSPLGLFEMNIQAKFIQIKKMLPLWTSLVICGSSRWVDAYPCAKTDAEVINKIFL